MSAHTPAPWLEPLQESLRAALAADRMPHALLIHAAAGTGGEELALWTAQLLLCTERERAPCGKCLACRRVVSAEHPDFMRLGPIEDSRQIRIEQVRELAAELSLTSHGRGWKVVILLPADALNANAANALLKTLEEPRPSTLLVLVTSQPSRLPATIRSRCLRLAVKVPPREQARAWLETQRPGEDWNAVLELVAGAPFAALEADAAAIAKLHEATLEGLADARAGRGDPVALAERWGRGDTAGHLRVIENWLSDCIRRQARGGMGKTEMRAAAHLSESRSELNIRSLFALLDQVRELSGQLDSSLNRPLAMEHLLRSFHAHSRTGRD